MSDGALEVLAIVSGLVGAAIVLGYFLGFSARLNPWFPREPPPLQRPDLEHKRGLRSGEARLRPARHHSMERQQAPSS
jgi:hypothetical protein